MPICSAWLDLISQALVFLSSQNYFCYFSFVHQNARHSNLSNRGWYLTWWHWPGPRKASLISSVCLCCSHARCTKIHSNLLNGIYLSGPFLKLDRTLDRESRWSVFNWVNKEVEKAQQLFATSPALSLFGCHDLSQLFTTAVSQIQNACRSLGHKPQPATAAQPGLSFLSKTSNGQLSSSSPLQTTLNPSSSLTYQSQRTLNMIIFPSCSLGFW